MGKTQKLNVFSQRVIVALNGGGAATISGRFQGGRSAAALSTGGCRKGGLQPRPLDAPLLPHLNDPNGLLYYN